MSDSTSPIQLVNESQKEYVHRLVKMLLEERARPRSDDLYGPVDYFASILYQHDALSHDAPVLRWYALREPLRDHWREKATQTIASWAMDEAIAKKASGA